MPPAFEVPKVIGYAPSWRPAELPYDRLTHINYAFALPAADGSIKQIENPGYLSDVVNRSRTAGVEVWLAVGGWMDHGAALGPIFESLARFASTRARFVADLIAIVDAFGLEGVDLDWEFPSAEAAPNVTCLVESLSSAMKARKKKLSIAVPPEAVNAHGLTRETLSHADHVNIMAYDSTAGGHHSSFELALEALALWKGRGCPASRCILGVPFYSRPSWRSFAAMLAAGADPNQDWCEGESYNGLGTIRKKAELARREAGGVMVWELTQDTTGTLSLLSAIDDVLRPGRRLGLAPARSMGDPNP